LVVAVAVRHHFDREQEENWISVVSKKLVAEIEVEIRVFGRVSTVSHYLQLVSIMIAYHK
jgi:hypothetical protein